MQSHAETIRKYGHARRPSYGKAMPVSALLMNRTMPHDRVNDTIAKDGISPEDETPPLLFTVDEVNSDRYQNIDAIVESETFNASDQTDCSVNAESEFVFVSLKDALPSSDDIETCPLTELCNLLCDNSCKKNENKFADNGGSDETNVKVRANDRQKFLSSMLADNGTSVVDTETTMTKVDILCSERIATEDYIDKLKVNEALVRTSMMTSPAARRRLAARKIEMELDAASRDAEDNEYVPPRQLLMYLVRYIIDSERLFHILISHCCTEVSTK